MESTRTKLTYLHPKTWKQELQWMSFTVCLPVINTRSSFGPKQTFTLHPETKQTKQKKRKKMEKQHLKKFQQLRIIFF